MSAGRGFQWECAEGTHHGSLLWLRPACDRPEPACHRRFHGFQGVDDADNAHVFSKKMIPENPDLKGYKVCGANIQYLAPEDPERKVRGPGLPGKSYRVPTTARIMGRGEHMHPQEVDPDLNMRRQLKPGEVRPGNWQQLG